MVKRGYILFFVMVMLAMGTALVTQIFYVGNLYNSYSAITLDRERARQLALGGVSAAMSQLMLFDTKLSPEPEKKEEESKKGQSKRAKNQKRLQELLLLVQNRWQTITLEHEVDGIDAQLKLCISCENGKIDCNKLYNYEIHKFLNVKGQNTEPFFRFVGQRLTPFLQKKDITEPLISFITTQKRPLLTATEFLKDKKIAAAFGNNIFYVPPLKELSKEEEAPEQVYLNDIFTVEGESYLNMWSLSPSLQKVLGLYSDKKMTAERAKEIVKQVQPNEIKNIEQLSRALEIIYGRKNNALPKDFMTLLNTKFEPRVFSVLCYAKVGRVGQKLLAIVEKSPVKDGEAIKMIKTYWI